MKFTMFLGVVALLVCLVQAQPLFQDFVELDESAPQLFDEDALEVEPTPESHSRQKRATCDLLSAWNVNHSACAAHCIGIGYNGGYCNDKAVCVCRR